MNEIRFEVRNYEYGRVVVPIIDGRSLIKELKEIELPFAKKEGSQRIAGAYEGLPIEIGRPPSQHYFGESELSIYEKKTEILVCECLEVGCWDFTVNVDLKDDSIIWNNFKQVHRKNWDYSRLNEPIFTKNQFDSALKELETS